MKTKPNILLFVLREITFVSRGKIPNNYNYINRKGLLDIIHHQIITKGKVVRIVKCYIG